MTLPERAKVPRSNSRSPRIASRSFPRPAFSPQPRGRTTPPPGMSASRRRGEPSPFARRGRSSVLRRRGPPFAHRSRRTTPCGPGATSGTAALPGSSASCPSARRSSRSRSSPGRRAKAVPSRGFASGERPATIAPALHPANTSPRSIARISAEKNDVSFSVAARCRGFPPEKNAMLAPPRASAISARSASARALSGTMRADTPIPA